MSNRKELMFLALALQEDKKAFTDSPKSLELRDLLEYALGQTINAFLIYNECPQTQRETSIVELTIA